MKHTTLAAIAPLFDAFLIDQFGVLLTGDGAYPSAPMALRQLAAMDKKILLLSNSGKRSEPNAARLTRLGFDRDSYQMVLSSGEAAYAVLADRVPTGHKVWLHARDNDQSAIDGLGLIPADDPGVADVLIVAGSQGDTMTLDQYRAILAPAAARGVPAYCTNPDMQMLTSAGQSFGAGRIAQLYESLGGKVDWIGKPFPMIYQVATRILGDVDPSRVLCIGDSPAHDIKGGRDAGFSTALVRTGIHAGEPEEQVLDHCRLIGAIPDFVLPHFDL